MAVVTFIHRFADEGDERGPVFNPETDTYLTPAEQARAGSMMGKEHGYDLTKAGYRTEYVGKVLGIFEENGYDDSDFCAYVEKAPGVFGKVVWGSTRSWTYLNGAEADATDDVYERYWEYRDAFWARHAAAKEADEATVARVGKAVTVTGGRKYKGRTGAVTWVGEAFHEWRMRVAPEEGGEAFFVPLRFTDLPEHENPSERIEWALAEMFRGAPQTRGSRVTAR